MADTPLDLAIQQALKSLADIATPAPVALFPQTWGWALVAILLLAALAMACWHWFKKRRANRYRREALQILDRLESDGDADTIAREVPILVKRVALAVWPRDAVAAQSGGAWVAFLQNALPDRNLGADLVHMLDDLEYHPTRESDPSGNPKQLLAAARHWIEKHHVPA
ncbi:protein of unknown function [Phyllobacterium sp. CL33Tsu]|uniref:DUF4381 domain-containing protein n=1 Tax=Phyllobacterium sp. CL33Tsu TaxID=1798191 RepID=UPI0008E14927|nr:DUF4381 domain-containing protein [Phyllobacterium sp. CL33Tsu]SFI95854.1 protein of unknown function [Phyllobacterium sp. CL33Tsu]